MQRKFLSITASYLSLLILINLNNHELMALDQAPFSASNTILFCDFEEAKNYSEPYTRVNQLILIADKLKQTDQKDRALQALVLAGEAAKNRKEMYLFYRITDEYVELGNSQQLLTVIPTLLELIKSSQEDVVIKSRELQKVANLYFKAGQKSQAESLLSQATTLIKSIDFLYSQVSPLADIAGQYAELGDKAKANEILVQAVDITKKVEDAYLRGEALKTISQKYLEIGMPEKIEVLLAESISILKTARPEYADSTGSVLHEITQLYVALGKYNQASQVGNSITNSEYKSRAWLSIVDGYVKTGKKNEALSTLTQAVSLVNKNQDKDWKDTILQEVAEKYANLGEYKLALQAAQKLDEIMRPDVLGKIVKISGNDTNKNRVKEVFSQALQTAKNIQNPERRTNAYTAIISNYSLEGQKQQINTVLSEALNLAKNFKNSAFRSTVLLEIANKYRQAGEKNKTAEVLSQALQITATLKDGQLKYDRVGHDVGYGDMTTIENVFSKPYLLEKIALTYAEIGQLEQAIKVAKTIKDVETQTSDLTILAGKYLDAKQPEKTVEILTQATTVAKSIDYPAFRDKALLNIAGGYIAAKLYDRAIAVSNDIEYTDYRLQVVQRVANAYLQAGNKNQALATISTGLAKVPASEQNDTRDRLVKRLACYQVN